MPFEGAMPAMELFGRNKVELSESDKIRNCIQWCLATHKGAGDRDDARDAMKHFKEMYAKDPKADQYRYRTASAKLNGETGYGIVLYNGEKLMLVHFVGPSRNQDIVCSPGMLAKKYEKMKAKAGKATESFDCDDILGIASEGVLADTLIALGDESYFDL